MSTSGVAILLCVVARVAILMRVVARVAILLLLLLLLLLLRDDVTERYVDVDGGRGLQVASYASWSDSAEGDAASTAATPTPRCCRYG